MRRAWRKTNTEDTENTEGHREEMRIG